jgi:hypothetical protein
MKAALLVAAILALALAACEYRIAGYGEQPRMTHEADRAEAFMVPHWVSGVDELTALGVCQQPADRIVEACAVDRGGYCIVYAVKPKDFNDVGALARLGHEVLHCLGGKHE